MLITVFENLTADEASRYKIAGMKTNVNDHTIKVKMPNKSQYGLSSIFTSDSQSFIWIENIGNNQFKKHDISNTPTHLLTLEPGDFINDGLTDFVTGGMHTYAPFDRMGRITLCLNNGAIKKSDAR